MDKNGSGVGCEGGAEAIDVPEVKVGRPGNVVYVGLEGKCVVKGDTQTLYLGRG